MMLWHNTNSVRALLQAAVAAGTAVIVTVVAVSAVADPVGAPLGASCPALYVLGVQGPDETSPDAAPTTDTGALGQLFGPLDANAGALVQRAYVRYGYRDDGTALPYDQAVSDADQRLEAMARDVEQRCPATRIAAAGYGQGAAAVAAFAHRVGGGADPIPAGAVAGIALLADPHRAPGAPVFPGRPGQATPDPAPGATGTATGQVQLVTTTPAGAGIDQNPTPTGQDTSFGSLTGRVADLCAAGDMTCDTPAGSPLAQTIHNIAAQSDLRDPVSAIATTAQALAATAWKTAAGVVTEDLSGDSLDQLSYQPTKSLGQRLAEASDPNTPVPGPDQALAVLFRLGTIGFNTVVSVAQKVFTPATIAELATVGMANPVAAIADLGTKVAGAVAELIPPQTALGWVDQAFDAISSTVTDNTQLYQLAARTQYSDTAGRQGSYTSVPATTSGDPPLTAVADWFTALAHDLGDRTGQTSTAPLAASPPPDSSSATEPSTTDSPSPTAPDSSAAPMSGTTDPFG
ncbi:cutinase family protein [Nocardia terpenica]|uniref:Cutinase n=1 Tax=Nocardia terpenica TaxID=455432 RepID=A0A161XB79_9NOCA|nr:cutinase family protein [Nocardia terpenica]KZM70408.1 hypothetical protein AWN90_03760 [Nocardia terpenica]NQE91089.1 cutinase family protein [Nocardia terpenica]